MRAFLNQANRVAASYRDNTATRAQHFDVMAFAIFAPGNGPDNYTAPRAVSLTDEGRSAPLEWSDSNVSLAQVSTPA
jgi:hypothetical protein